MRLDTSSAFFGFGHFFPRAQTSAASHEPVELTSSILLACISGIIATALHFSANDHDVKRFYARTHVCLYAAYVFCTFVVWFSFVLNARYAVLQFAKLCMTRLQPLPAT
jgi:hypothetical protein